MKAIKRYRIGSRQEVSRATLLLGTGLAALAPLGGLTACGGGGGGDGSDAPATAQYRLGGSVTGLKGTLTLANGSSSRTVDANGSFAFADKLKQGDAYDVTLRSQPTSQTCSVANGQGTVGAADVSNVAVTCADNAIASYALGGTVSGLAGTLLLRNGSESLSITANGAFAFSSRLANAASYAVTVQAQPSGQTCTVSGASGTVGSADVSSLTVTCSTASAGTAAPPRLSAQSAGVADGYTLAARAGGALHLIGSSTAHFAISPSLGMDAVAGTSARSWAGHSASTVATHAHRALFVSAGTLHGWGLNDYGVLGGQFNLAASTPQALSGVSDVVSAVTAESTTLALRADGTLWNWPGVLTWTASGGAISTPRQIPGLSNVWRVVQGPDSTYVHERLDLLFIKTDGTVWTLDATGTIGTSPDGFVVQTFSFTSRQITGLGAVDNLACQSDCLVLRKDGSVALWSNATIPSGGLSVAVTATEVAGLSGIRSLARSNNASIAVGSDGRVWTWGYPGSDVIGSTTDTDVGAGHGQASRSLLSAPTLLTSLSGAVEASCSFTHCAVRLSNGQLWSWGRNSNGELGDGSTVFRATPVQATGINLN